MQLLTDRLFLTDTVDHVGIAPAESPLPVGETPETGEIPESFGRAKPSVSEGGVVRA